MSEYWKPSMDMFRAGVVVVAVGVGMIWRSAQLRQREKEEEERNVIVDNAVEVKEHSISLFNGKHEKVCAPAQTGGLYIYNLPPGHSQYGRLYLLLCTIKR